MFYSYRLSFERASSVTFSKSVSVVAGQLTGATERTAPVGREISVASPQVICGISPQPNPFSSGFSSGFGTGSTYPVLPSPFSSEFSAEFGGGFGTGYVLVTVGKLVSATDARNQSTSKFSFVPNAKIINVSSGESASRSARRGAFMPSSVLSREVIALNYARPWHVIGAGTSSSAGRVLRSMAKVLAIQYSQLTRIRTAISRNILTSSSESSSLTRRLNMLRVSISSQALSTTRGIGRIFSAGMAEAILVRKASGIAFRGVNPESAAIVRGNWPYRLSAISSGSAQVSFGNNIYQRVLGAFNGQANSMRRGMSVFLSLFLPLVASAVKGPGKKLSTLNAGSTSLLSQYGLLRGMVNAQAIGFQRRVGLIRVFISVALQALLKTGSHLTGALDSQSSQLAAASEAHGVNRVASLVGSQSSSGEVSAISSLFRTIGAVSAQAAKSIHLLAAPRLLTALNANRASIRQTLAMMLSAIGAQFGAVSSSIGRSVFVVSSQAIALANRFFRGLNAVLPNVAALKKPFGLLLSTILALTYGVIKLTNKLQTSLFSPQSTRSGRGGTKVVGTTTPSMGDILFPRGIARGTIHGQRAQSVAYYHFYVASWAYQQNSRLPPSGGPAEPPSFGPIDPADQTIFAFDWSSRAYTNDAILSAKVISVPPGLSFLAPPFINGTLIEVTVIPFIAPALPTIFSLRCTAAFASGRVSSFSIPVPVRTL